MAAVHQILATAIRMGASDIHIEPMADEGTRCGCGWTEVCAR